MRKTLLLLACLLFATGQGFCAQGASELLSLADCYRLALKQSELIAVDTQRIKEAEGRFLQAFGTILPQVSFARTDTFQDSETYGNSSYEQKFVFTQALFSGFKEFAAIASSRFEKKQFQQEKLRAEQLLFVDVADAFYLLLEVRRDLETLEMVKQALVDRISELKKREGLGKSRPSEVVSTETQLYILEDQVQSVKNREKVARDLLDFLAGVPVGEITETGTEYALRTEPEYLAKTALRPDVKAAAFEWEAAKKETAAARSGFLPSVNAEADYFTPRSSAPKDSEWQALLKVSVPIFEGTTTYGEVKEAAAKARQKGLLSRRAERSAGLDVRSAYANAKSAFSRSAILEQAVKSAALNYELQEKDYRLNVVNNLEVLTALQELQNVRRTYNHMYYESRRLYWQLEAAAGSINPDIYR